MKLKAFVLATLLSPLAMADDTGNSYGGGSDSSGLSGREMVEVRRFLEREQYKAATLVLNQIIEADRRNADAWNLLGYSQRKLGNLKRSAKYYSVALKLNPDHKGALEYQGQLFITQNKINQAKDNQRRLNELCPQGCEQLSSLTQALVDATGS